MSMSIEISFSKTSKPSGGLVIALGSVSEPVSPAARTIDPAGQLDKAVKVSGFAGKSLTSADIIAPVDSPADRIALLGTGDPDKLTPHDWLRFGGKIVPLISKSRKVTMGKPMTV